MTGPTALDKGPVYCPTGTVTPPLTLASRQASTTPILISAKAVNRSEHRIKKTARVVPTRPDTRFRSAYSTSPKGLVSNVMAFSWDCPRTAYSFSFHQEKMLFT